MGQTEPQFLSDSMSDRKKKFSPTLVIVTCVGFLLFMVLINQHGLEVARRCYSGEEVEKALQNTRGGVTG
jgi:hypothetical protein